MRTYLTEPQIIQNLGYLSSDSGDEDRTVVQDSNCPAKPTESSYQQSSLLSFWHLTGSQVVSLISVPVSIFWFLPSWQKFQVPTSKSNFCKTKYFFLSADLTHRFTAGKCQVLTTLAKVMVESRRCHRTHRCLLKKKKVAAFPLSKAWLASHTFSPL